MSTNGASAQRADQTGSLRGTRSVRSTADQSERARAARHDVMASVRRVHRVKTTDRRREQLMMLAARPRRRARVVHSDDDGEDDSDGDEEYDEDDDDDDEALAQVLGFIENANGEQQALYERLCALGAARDDDNDNDNAVVAARVAEVALIVHTLRRWTHAAAGVDSDDETKACLRAFVTLCMDMGAVAHDADDDEDHPRATSALSVFELLLNIVAEPSAVPAATLNDATHVLIGVTALTNIACVPLVRMGAMATIGTCVQHVAALLRDLCAQHCAAARAADVDAEAVRALSNDVALHTGTLQHLCTVVGNCMLDSYALRDYCVGGGDDDDGDGGGGGGGAVPILSALINHVRDAYHVVETSACTTASTTTLLDMYDDLVGEISWTVSLLTKPVDEDQDEDNADGDSDGGDTAASTTTTTTTTSAAVANGNGGDDGDGGDDDDDAQSHDSVASADAQNATITRYFPPVTARVLIGHLFELAMLVADVRGRARVLVDVLSVIDDVVSLRHDDELYVEALLTCARGDEDDLSVANAVMSLLTYSDGREGVAGGAGGDDGDAPASTPELVAIVRHIATMITSHVLYGTDSQTERMLQADGAGGEHLITTLARLANARLITDRRLSKPALRHDAFDALTALLRGTKEQCARVVRSADVRDAVYAALFTPDLSSVRSEAADVLCQAVQHGEQSDVVDAYFVGSSEGVRALRATLELVSRPTAPLWLCRNVLDAVDTLGCTYDDALLVQQRRGGGGSADVTPYADFGDLLYDVGAFDWLEELLGMVALPDELEEAVIDVYNAFRELYGDLVDERHDDDDDGDEDDTIAATDSHDGNGGADDNAAAAAALGGAESATNRFAF